jgi:hypothetical protein
MLDDARDLAFGLHFEWDDRERVLLAPLVDATIMRIDPDRLDEIARPIVAALWDGLRPLLETEVVDPEVAADLARGPAASTVALAVVEQAAMDLADHAFFLEDCLDCIEEGLQRGPSPALAERAGAAIALHCNGTFGASPPTDDERDAVRGHVRTLAALGRESLPNVAAALEELAATPLPPPADDRLVQAVLRRRRAAVAGLN